MRHDVEQRDGQDDEGHAGADEHPAAAEEVGQVPHDEDRRDVDGQHDGGRQGGGVRAEAQLLMDVGGHVAQQHVEGHGVEAGDTEGDEHFALVGAQELEQRLDGVPGALVLGQLLDISW